MYFKYGVAAIAASFFLIGGSAAYADTVQFDDWESTNGTPLVDPVVTASDEEMADYIAISIDISDTSIGSLSAVYIDAGGVMFTADDFMASVAIICWESPSDASDGISNTTCSESNVNLGGLSDLSFDLGIAFDKEAVPVTVYLSDSLVALSDLERIGLRFQEVGADGEASDKLISGTVSPVPVPPALPLLAAGLALTAVIGRRRKAS